MQYETVEFVCKLTVNTHFYTLGEIHTMDSRSSSDTEDEQLESEISDILKEVEERSKQRQLQLEKYKPYIPHICTFT